MSEVGAHPAATGAELRRRPLIEIRQVRKRFGQLSAIDNASLDLNSGCFVTLLGPSGCGKTTLLRMIGGLEWPDTGDILIGGRPVGSYSAAERATRMVFQSYALFPHMTVERNVGYGLRMRRLAADEIRIQVTEQLALVGLSDKATAYPNELSGGQQQRVALARALVTKPLVLLLDEPLAALDLKLRQRMQTELKSLQRAAGITFIYVTHDQHEALALSDEIVVMQTGRIVQRGTPADIYRRPVNHYVADFVGDATIVKARIKSIQNGTTCVETSWGGLRSTAPVAPLAVDSEVVALIRPEDVLLGRGESNNFVAKVRGTTYRGMDLLTDLEVGDTLVRMSVPGSQDAAVTLGAIIEVHIREAALWLFTANNTLKE